MAIQIDGFGQVEIIGEDQHFAQRIDTQLLIMGDSFFSPFHRVAGIVAQPLIAGGEFRTEIAQERIHSDAVGQRDAQLVGILFQPGGKGRPLAAGKAGADLLVGLEPLMGLGTHRG